MTAISNPGAPDGRNNWEDDPGADLGCRGRGDESAAVSRVIWSDEDPPGGYVCAECWMPVESEPCPEHGSEPLSADLEPGEWIGSTVEDLRGAYRFATELSREWGIRVRLRIDANSGGFEVFAA